MGNTAVASEELREFFEQVERIDEDIKDLKADRKDVLLAIKARGFCTKTFTKVLKERKQTPEQRREEQALLQIMRAAMGMLDGTPLGEYALRRLAKPDPVDPKPLESHDGKDTMPPKAASVLPDVTVDGARDLGRKAAKDGIDVIQNPFPGGDPRRAAWDEAWCSELGSDGMEIPEALRPPAKKSKKDEPSEPSDETDDADDASEDGDGEEDSGDAEDQDPPFEPDAKDDGKSSDDAEYAKVRAFVISNQRASVSLLRKSFSIGYDKAARLIDRLARDGVISPPDMAGNRNVLLDQEGNSK